MKFGAFLSSGVWWEDILMFDKCLSEIEGLGYDAIFIPDHPINLMLPSPRPIYTLQPLDCWTTLSYIAGKTKNVRLGALVSPITRYVPSQLAKVIATLDILSKGRVVAGVGSGYIPEEFVNYSPIGAFEPHRIRVERLGEGLEVMARLWTDDIVSFNGKYYKLKDAYLEPKPIQKPYPPLWAGVQGKLAIKMIMKYCNGWVTPELRYELVEVAPGKWRIRFLCSITPEIYERNINYVKNCLKESGKSIDNFTFAFFGINSGTPEDIAKIEKFMQAGCNYWIADIDRSLGPETDRSYEKYMRMLRNIAKNVIPSF
ncbi:MAG: LLM class flavin-dependent oxidoreductase [Candidatus Bathyarchaeia archaeon]